MSKEVMYIILIFAFVFISPIAAEGEQDIAFSEQGRALYGDWLEVHDDLFAHYSLISDDIIPSLEETLEVNGDLSEVNNNNGDIQLYLEKSFNILAEISSRATELEVDWETVFFKAQIDFDKWSLQSYMGQDLKSAHSYFENCFSLASSLETVNNSEAARLIGDIYSAKIRYSGGSGAMTWGMRSSKMYSRAISLNSDNGAALLGYGIGLFFTPPIGGGSKKKALKYLNNAVDVAIDQNTLMMGGIWQSYVTYKMGNIEDAVDSINYLKDVFPKQVLIYELIRYYKGYRSDPFAG